MHSVSRVRGSTLDHRRCNGAVAQYRPGRDSRMGVGPPGEPCGVGPPAGETVTPATRAEVAVSPEVEAVLDAPEAQANPRERYGLSPELLAARPSCTPSPEQVYTARQIEVAASVLAEAGACQPCRNCGALAGLHAGIVWCDGRAQMICGRCAKAARIRVGASSSVPLAEFVQPAPAVRYRAVGAVSAAQVQRCVELRGRGATMTAIATELGIAPRAVRSALDSVRRATSSAAGRSTHAEPTHHAHPRLATPD